ncbi:hypothetical protein KO528_01440 [Saccharophagus degradans]|uniref:hypothetical protein n=1 Tax=Saccharophagus degradans TaxID=86304 RepID=UPI001C085540|nr:hypothetical protein [Saccharophagus degradans]MBU2984001.1 hypothetical protein [Saccharophagus degradans]
MKLGTTLCKNCNLQSSRNIHNKCVYCGHLFEEAFHVTEAERSGRLREIDETTERMKSEIKVAKDKEKQREADVNDQVHIHSMNNLF